MEVEITRELTWAGKSWSTVGYMTSKRTGPDVGPGEVQSILQDIAAADTGMPALDVELGPHTLFHNLRGTVEEATGTTMTQTCQENGCKDWKDR